MHARWLYCTKFRSMLLIILIPRAVARARARAEHTFACGATRHYALVFIGKGMTKPGFLRSGRAKEEHKVATPCFEPIPTLARSTNDRIVCELGDTPPKHPIYCHISPPKAQNSPKLTKSVSRVVFYMVIDPTTIIEKIFLPPLFRPPPPLALGWAFPSVSHNIMHLLMGRNLAQRVDRFQN